MGADIGPQILSQQVCRSYYSSHFERMCRQLDGWEEVEGDAGVGVESRVKSACTRVVLQLEMSQSYTGKNKRMYPANDKRIGAIAVLSVVV